MPSHCPLVSTTGSNNIIVGDMHYFPNQGIYNVEERNRVGLECYPLVTRLLRARGECLLPVHSLKVSIQLMQLYSLRAFMHMCVFMLYACFSEHTYSYEMYKEATVLAGSCRSMLPRPSAAAPCFTYCSKACVIQHLYNPAFCKIQPSCEV